MKVACLPEGAATPAGTDLRFELYARAIRSGVGRVGGLVPAGLLQARLSPSPRAWDFCSIALAVVAADEAVTRSKSPNGWTREIDLTVSVSEPDFWADQAHSLETALRFLTDDLWTVGFVRGDPPYAPLRRPSSRKEDCVCLLSGGMDSLIGAIDAVAAGRRPLLVSQKAKGDSADQKRFAERISNGTLHLQLNHHARPPGTSERSQRARSIVFLGFGALAASCLDRVRDGGTADLLVPENGFISQNVPLTPLRIGAHSTRTTHPFVLRTVQSVIDQAGLNVRIHNPYEHATKGEMLVGCSDQNLVADLIWDSTSCGRYSRTGFQHCGRCVPCQVRRAAVLAWGQTDATTKGYKYDPLGQADAKHAGFDDVRSVSMAIDVVARRGIDALIGGAMNSEQLGDVAPYREVIRRGIAELAMLHQREGVT